jgi:imidazolonepropionase
MAENTPALTHELDLLVTNVRTSAGVTATIGVKDGIFALPAPNAHARSTIDAQGHLALPGFIDCHTHAVYAGSRLDEHLMKRRGASYTEIAAAGGGIRASVRAVRAASEDDLVAQSLPRLLSLTRSGVTTAEVKSGYGLDLATELKMLRAIQRLQSLVPMTLVPTFLGAHTVPDGMTADTYIHTLCTEMIPAVAQEKLAKFCDIYVEDGAFSLHHLDEVANASYRHGLELRVHAEQFSHLGASARAAHWRAVSADHLEHTTDMDAQAMAQSGTIAVLLPGAFYALRETQLPPIDSFRRHGVPMAIATDLNPGTSPVADFPTALHLAATMFRLTPDELFEGATRHPARVLGVSGGTLDPGTPANFTLWDMPNFADLTYYLGLYRPSAVYYKGIRS